MASSNTRKIRPATANVITAYIMHHLQSLVFSLGKIYLAPITTIMTVAVIGITLSLPAGFFVFLKNIDAISAEFRSTSQISLFMALSLSEEDARAIEAEIRTIELVSSTIFVSRDVALEDFRQSSGFGKSIDTLSSNPLPHTIIVEPIGGIDTFDAKNLLNQLQAIDGVEIAKLDTEWLERLFTLLEIAERSILVLTLLFACAVLLIIGNTIRLDIQNRYQEIIVTKLIGATDSFIRRPFLYGGVWYGLFGGLLAWLIVEIGFLSIASPLQKLTLLYQSEFGFQTFSFVDFIILVTSSTLLGLAGSWIAVAKHLNKIEPT